MEREETQKRMVQLCLALHGERALGEVLEAVRAELPVPKSTVYRTLAELAELAAQFVQGAEDEDPMARYQLAILGAAEAAIRISYLALTTAEIDALAEEAIERLDANPLPLPTGTPAPVMTAQVWAREARLVVDVNADPQERAVAIERTVARKAIAAGATSEEAHAAGQDAAKAFWAGRSRT